MAPDPLKTVQSQKVLWGSIAITILLAAGCLVCLAAALLAGGLRWRSELQATVQSGLAGLRHTPTLTGLHPSATPNRQNTLTPTLMMMDVFSPTLTLDWLSITQPLSTTLAPVTTTLTLSATQILAEPSSTPAPALSSWCIPLNTPFQNARVIRVIDGVSIEVEMDGNLYSVRYLGIALPDAQIGSPAWTNALQHNRELVEGKVVLLARDQTFRDMQGWLPRYVISEGIFVNRSLVENGYAVAQSTPPDISCEVVLHKAEELAQLTQHGIWRPTPTPTRTPLPPTPTIAISGNVRIAYIKYWGVGWQDPNEFVEIRNDSPWPVQLKGWTVSDLQGRQFTFPSFILNPGIYCRVYTHKYVPGMCTFSFYHPAGIWDDEGDCAFLKDAFGNLVDKLCYD